MDNRTIRTAITKRIPEIYFVSKGEIIRNKVKFVMVARINNRPYYICADMPNTALISHRELLNTMVSEVYDEVAKIKSGAKSPPIVPDERHLPPLNHDDLEAYQFNEIEDMITTKPILLLE